MGIYRPVAVGALLAAMALAACGGGSGSGPGAAGAGASPLSGTPITQVYEGDAYVFQPIVSDRGDAAPVFKIVNAPPWASFDPQTGRLSGTPGPDDVGIHSGIRIGISGAADAWLAPFDIIVTAVSRGAVTVTWEPPAENTDDSPLQDLAGFHIYWGTEPGEFSRRVIVDNPGLTAYVVEGLSPGTYFFATTAYNAFGTESALSETATVVVREPLALP